MPIDRLALVAEARSWIGTPYAHQQSLKGVGCDCLGLVRGLWRFAFGEEPELIHDYSSDWAEARGEETMLEAARRHMVEVHAPLQPGDVLMFRWRPHLPAKHCAVLTGPGRITHAYDAAGRVCEVTLAPAWWNRLAGSFSFPGLD